MSRLLTRTHKKIRGLAISTILLAVVLLAAIAVTIAMSSRSSSGNSSTQQANLNASTLMNQAANMRIGFDRMQANGVAASTITLDTAGGTGLFNPTDGGTVQQFPPAAAYVSPPSPPQWIYNSNIKLEGIGTTATDYVVLIPHVTLAVCQAVMKQLYGMTDPIQTTAATATIGNLTGNAAVDFDSGTDSAHATQNRPEGCFGDVTGNWWFYYKAVVEN